MNTKKPLKIAVLPGDGIGIEVTHAAIEVFKALDIPVQLNFGDIGWTNWQHEGNPIPDKTWKLIAESDTTLLGAITSKPQREATNELDPRLQKDKPVYLSPIIQLRQKLDLFANIRPGFSIINQNKQFNFCVIRENTEGLYSGFDYHPVPKELLQLLEQNPRWQNKSADELSCSLRLQSKAGLTRLFEFAFSHAVTHQINRVTFADKPNVLRKSGHFAREIFESIAHQYPQITSDILNIDAVALWLIKRPEDFGVIVTENMFGDILSDVGAGVMGGLGLAPSANIGQQESYFEPVHGSGPQMSPNTANPGAMFLTISMLLLHFGFAEPAKRITKALGAVIQENRFVTYDLGGKATTSDMAKAVIDRCVDQQQKATSKINNDISMTQYLKKLKTFTTAEISDALDSCGIEGALCHIKPLTPGIKLAGPAYTIQYETNQKKSSSFKNAANYIDAVPANSVIVIDNKGLQDCTVWGEILTQVAMKNHIEGTVVHGAVRDVESIRKTNYPLFCSATSMRSGKNRVHKTNQQCPLMINDIPINPGDIIFGDDNGALVIPKQLLPELLNRAERIKLTEQRIAAAVKSGSTLEQAREDYGYAQPWAGINKTKDNL